MSYQMHTHTLDVALRWHMIVLRPLDVKRCEDEDIEGVEEVR